VLIELIEIVSGLGQRTQSSGIESGCVDKLAFLQRKLRLDPRSRRARASQREGRGEIELTGSIGKGRQPIGSLGIPCA
jgi:hypothetical protein